MMLTGDRGESNLEDEDVISPRRNVYIFDPLGETFFKFSSYLREMPGDYVLSRSGYYCMRGFRIRL
jgi:hypothetical protein